jgi:hypothetical protein
MRKVPLATAMLVSAIAAKTIKTSGSEVHEEQPGPWNSRISFTAVLCYNKIQQQNKGKDLERRGSGGAHKTYRA